MVGRLVVRFTVLAAGCELACYFFCLSSRKHTCIVLTPLNPTFFIVKLGFTGVYIIFLISAKNIDCGYSLVPPREGISNEYPSRRF